MNRNLLITLIIGVTFLAASCRKYVVTPGSPALSGRWYLQSAQRYDSYNWQLLHTGYEPGTFTFFGNGDASYSDALGSLQGRWEMYPVTDGYYDSHGNYQERYRTVFKLSLYNSSGNSPELNWSFDDSDFRGGSSFKASYTTSSYLYEYTFAKE